MLKKIFVIYITCFILITYIIIKKVKIKIMRNKQAKIKEMLKIVLPIFNNQNIPYWADFGTLLGIIREKDVILYDYDADFCIDLNNINKLYNKTVKNALIEKGLCLVKSKNSTFKIYYLSTVKNPNAEYFYKPTTHIDIFPFRFEKNYALRAKLNWHKESNGYLKKHNKYCITDSCDSYLVKEIKKVWVEAWNNYCNIPKNHHKLLKYRYGNNYMTPMKSFKENKDIIEEKFNKFKSFYKWDM